MPDDVQLLLDYARGGDVESLSALVTRHSRWLSALLRGLLPGRAEADDALQDVWMRVIRSASAFRGGNVRSYLARVARAVAMDRLRRLGRTVSLDVPDEEGRSAAEEIPATGPGPHETAELNAAAQEVRAAVGRLPDGPRQVLLLRIEAEMSYREIAAEMGVPLGTALTWMRTATLQLKKELGVKA